MKKAIFLIFVFSILLCGCSTRQEGILSDYSSLNNRPLLFEDEFPISDELKSAVTDLPQGVTVMERKFNNVNVLYPSFNNENVDLVILEELTNYFKDKNFQSDTDFDFFVSSGQQCISIVFYDNTSASSSMRNIFCVTLTSDYSELVDITRFITYHEPMQHIYETIDKLYGIEGAFKNDNLPEFFVDKRGIVVIDSLGQRFTIPKDNFHHVATRKVNAGKNYEPVTTLDEKVVALTFDDGPNYKTTSSLLSMLIEKDVKATFFVVGCNVPGNEYLLRKMLEHGCDVGVHSYSHSNFDNMSFEEVMDDIYNCSEIIRAATDISPHLVRPPYGNISDEIVYEKEYYYVNWSVDPVDYYAESPEQIVESICSNIRSGDIVLLHDIYQASCDAAEMIVDKLIKDGWRFVTVSELFDMRSNPPKGEIYYGLGY